MVFLTNPNGSRLVVYRGEHGPYSDKAFQSRLGSLYFSTREVANHYALNANNAGEVAEQPRVFPTYLSINKPFMNDPNDPYIELSLIEERLGTWAAVRMAVRFSSLIEVTDNWRESIDPEGKWGTVLAYLRNHPEGLKNLYFQAYPFFADKFVVTHLKREGYDGAIHGGSGWASAQQPEYCVFDHRQAVSIFAI